METNPKLEEQIKKDHGKILGLLEMMGRRLVGQKLVAERLVMALISEGHVLLEGLPGLAKTTAVKTLSDASDLSVARIQFTPDLLPADVLGTQIYDPKNGGFKVKKGPIFTNLLIADEINRAPAKVQSALLEAMQERQVTLGDETFTLEKPFLVMATQNPIEQEGTYPLPEAQMDRFLFKVKVHYGTMGEEEQIIARMSGGDDIPLDKVVSKSDILRMRETAHEIYVADKIRRYIVQVVFSSREPGKHGMKELERFILYGASPRASINLERAARVNALLQGRSFVTPQDIKDVGHDVLRHRIILSYEGEAEGMTSDEVVKRIFERVDVP
jgi:MoxR-like ATPase